MRLGRRRRRCYPRSKKVEDGIGLNVVGRRPFFPVRGAHAVRVSKKFCKPPWAAAPLNLWRDIRKTPSAMHTGFELDVRELVAARANARGRVIFVCLQANTSTTWSRRVRGSMRGTKGRCQRGEARESVLDTPPAGSRVSWKCNRRLSTDPRDSMKISFE